jgi:predicted ABC-type ATPase
MIQPLLVIVAGPNGSGKSTLIRQLRSSPNVDSPNLYINADDLKAQLELTDAAAQSLAQQLRKNAIEQRESLIFKTVASHPSKISELQQAVLAGYRCHVILIATDNPAINVDRVAHRVRNGGHDVPENRIRDRYQRTLALFPSMIEQASEALIFDNTSSNAVDHTLQAVLVRDDLVVLAANQASWVRDLIAKVAARNQERYMVFQAIQGDMGHIEKAILEDGVYTGSIVMISAHYVLQYTQLQQFVLHDRSLISGNLVSLEESRNYSISYQQGVAQVEIIL